MCRNGGLVVVLCILASLGICMFLFGVSCWCIGWFPIDINYSVVLPMVVGCFLVGISVPFVAFRRSRNRVNVDRNIRGLLTRWDSESRLVINETTPLLRSDGCC